MDIIETLPGGRQRVRFATVKPKQTSAAMTELVTLWQRAVRERLVPLPIALAAANLDFLCIHPKAGKESRKRKQEKKAGKESRKRKQEKESRKRKAGKGSRKRAGKGDRSIYAIN